MTLRVAIETHDLTKIFKSKARSLEHRSSIFERKERASIQMVLPEILTLALMCAILLPVGYLIYSWCLRTAKKNGT